MPFHDLIALWISAGTWVAMEWWVWLREIGGTAGTNRDRGTRFWIVALLWIGLYLAIALARGHAGHIRRGVEAWFWIGLACIWLGAGLRFWAIRTLGQFFRTSVIIQGQHRMITSGPYRFLRNPSYTGASLSFAGVGLAMRNWYSLAVLLACVLIGYARRIAVEQEVLEAHFGEPYRDYIARSWALIPLVW